MSYYKTYTNTSKIFKAKCKYPIKICYPICYLPRNIINILCFDIAVAVLLQRPFATIFVSSDASTILFRIFGIIMMRLLQLSLAINILSSDES